MLRSNVPYKLTIFVSCDTVSTDKRIFITLALYRLDFYIIGNTAC